MGEANKASAYGDLRLWMLMTAVLMQALWGLVSDRSRLPWGRRRPFIFAGTLVMLVIMLGLGSLFSAEGRTGYLLLCGVVILMSIFSNLPQAAAQAIIPDLAPVNKRGVFSGVKAVLEIPLPVILVSFTVGKFLAQGNPWGAIFAAMLVLAACMLLTMLIPDQPAQGDLAPLDWQPYLNLVAMTAAFAALIFGLGQLLRFFARLVPPGMRLEEMLLWAGLAGLAAMVAAILGGVLLGVRIGLGPEAGRNRAFTWWVVNRLAFLAGMINLSTFAVFYFQSRLGYSQMEAAKPASQLIYVVGVMIFAAALAGGWLTDRLGHRRVLAASGLLAAAGVAVMLISASLTLISVGGGLVGLAAGLFYTANWALGTQLAPPDQAARYLGISNLAGAGAGAIGAYLGGPIADLFSRLAPNNPGIGYVLLFGIYGVLFLMSSLTVRGIRQAGSE